jgi:hypothetical protein
VVNLFNLSNNPSLLVGIAISLVDTTIIELRGSLLILMDFGTVVATGDIVGCMTKNIKATTINKCAVKKPNLDNLQP